MIAVDEEERAASPGRGRPAAPRRRWRARRPGRRHGGHGRSLPARTEPRPEARCAATGRRTAAPSAAARQRAAGVARSRRDRARGAPPPRSPALPRPPGGAGRPAGDPRPAPRLRPRAAGRRPAADRVGPHRSQVADYLATHVDGETYRVWVAEDGGRIVAMAGLVIVDRPPHPRSRRNGEGFVVNVYTLPRWRGSGVGRAVMDALVAEARRCGCDASSCGRPTRGARCTRRWASATPGTTSRSTSTDATGPCRALCQAPPTMTERRDRRHRDPQGVDTSDRLAQDGGRQDDGRDRVERPSTAARARPPAWADTRKAALPARSSTPTSMTSPTRRGRPRNEARIGVRPGARWPGPAPTRSPGRPRSGRRRLIRSARRRCCRGRTRRRPRAP